MNDEHPYRDRHEAGRVLAAHVQEAIETTNAVVLALPRGGVPVGFEVAGVLDAPLDVIVVRKLGVPQRPELAMGAIASGGFRVLDQELIGRLGLTAFELAAVADCEAAELARREVLYRGNDPAFDLHGRDAILVDDGLVTGSTMRAAMGSIRQLGARRVIVAVPVGAWETCAEIAGEVDALICPLRPRRFQAVGQWYENFAPTTDDEVRECLAAVHATHRE